MKTGVMAAENSALVSHDPHVSHGYICSNGQKYIAWVTIIDFSFMPKVIRILSKDHEYLPWRYFVNFLL